MQTGNRMKIKCWQLFHGRLKESRQNGTTKSYARPDQSAFLGQTAYVAYSIPPTTMDVHPHIHHTNGTLFLQIQWFLEI